MAFWPRIRSNNLKIACTQFRRCYIQLPDAPSFNPTPKPCPFQIPNPYWAFRNTPTRVFNSVRFFAAPVQFQSKWKKEDEDDDDGERRLNEQITAKYVRLVLDDGHSIVSRFEALERARMLKLDLVEVQRNGNPPVVKIMDYHKELYKKQQQEKERAKIKSETSLRKGECKEMRISEKTEAKDLKMKADRVKKLMEKGYRVKCKATGKENQDMMGVLSRLHALIEDITVVESGPSMAKKEAFMIVRHIKYGLPKKGGAAQKLQDAANMAPIGQEDDTEPLTAGSSDSIKYENQNFAESGLEAEEDVFYTSGPVPPAEPENRYKKRDHRSENKVQSHATEPPQIENRYKRADPRDRFQQMAPNNAGQNYRGPGTRDAVRPLPSMNQTRRVPTDTAFNNRTGNTNHTNTPGPGSRYSRPPFENNHRQGPPNPGGPNVPRSDYGFYSPLKGPEAQGVRAGMHRSREGNPQDSTRQPNFRESR